MLVVNAMFGRQLGGIEQSFVDYSSAIAAHGHKVVALIHPAARIRNSLSQLENVTTVTVRNFGQWDLWAKMRLARLMKEWHPDAVIAHGKRAVLLLKDPVKQAGAKLVGVTHNYELDYQLGLDGVFATTQDLYNKLVALGQPEHTVHRLPNMVRLCDRLASNPKNPVPIIGAMGRFVAKKGFNVFLQSLAELKQQGIAFKAVIGGHGEDDAQLKSLVKVLNISDVVTFQGWIEDKQAFIQGLDIFCFPSLHEPFGIVLLEAFMFGVPVVTTDSEGPSEIAVDGQDALVVPKGDPIAMAAALRQLIENPEFAQSLANNAYLTVQQYGLNAVGLRACEILGRLVAHK